MHFCHLHVHSDRSLLDGLPSPESIVKKAKELGTKAVAITDHGNLFALPVFYQSAIENDIKPILGCEFYYVDKYDFDKTRESYHLLLLAKNQEGLNNLYSLSTESFINGFYYNPRINKRLIEKYRNGLIVTTGCIASSINAKILSNNIKEAKKEFEYFLELFGDDFYIELQYHNLKKQDIVNRVLLEWSKKYNVKIIGTNDAHYINRDDYFIHDALLAIQTGSVLSDKKRFRFTDDNDQISKEFYMKSYEEMLSIPVFKENPEALQNTLEIAEKCEAKIEYNDKLLLPFYDTGNKSQDDYLRDLVYKRLSLMYKNNVPEYVLERVNHELDVIKNLGFSGYFLIVSDIVHSAKSMGIYVGPGRGSAVGSMVAYVLGITHINPIKYDLLFERFLNPERISPPDIDIDFEDTRREDVINYIRNKYGEDKISHIITYSFMGVRAALRDALRVLGVEPKEINKISDLLPKKAETLEDIFSEENEKSKELKDLFSKNETYKKALEIAKAIIGKPRQVSMHASGIVIAPKPLKEYTPLAVVTSDVKDKKDVVTQYDMHILEKLGLLKVDILGLKTLSIIKEVVQNVKKYKGIDIDIYNLDTNDEKTWNIFRTGNTVGVFQFESDGIKKVLVEVSPDNMEELIAINALYRPGPLEQIPEYINRKRNPEKITYFHEKAIPILKNTYGIMIYQEQVMQIAQALAGFTLAQADEFRRGIGKGEKEKIEKNKDKFIEGCVKNGLSREEAENIFNLILKFAGYGFNKSHAAAYSYLAYVTAYLKANYPEYFYCAMLNNNINDYEEIEKIYIDARMNNIEINKPDINQSVGLFSIKNNTIYHGLYAIRNIRKEHVDYILLERQNGVFKDIDDFVQRISKYNIDKRTIEALVYSTSLDNISPVPKQVLYSDENISAIIKAQKDNSKISKNTTLFDVIFGDDINVKIEFNKNATVSDDFIKQKQKEFIGYDEEEVEKMLEKKKQLSLYEQLIQQHEEFISENNIMTTYDKDDNTKNIHYCALVYKELEEKMSKNGLKYYEVTFLDRNKNFKVVLYNQNLCKILEKNNLYFVEIKHTDKYKFVSNIILFEKNNYDLIKSIVSKKKNNNTSSIEQISKNNVNRNIDREWVLNIFLHTYIPMIDLNIDNETVMFLYTFTMKNVKECIENLEYDYVNFYIYRLYELFTCYPILQSERESILDVVKSFSKSLRENIF